MGTKRRSLNKCIMCNAYKSLSKSNKTKEKLFNFHDEWNSMLRFEVLLATQIKKEEGPKILLEGLNHFELSYKSTATLETKFWTQLSIECINLSVEQLVSRASKKGLGTDSLLNANVLSTLTLMFLVVPTHWLELFVSGRGLDFFQIYSICDRISPSELVR